MSTFADEASLERLSQLEKELAAVKAQARDTASELTLAYSDAACLQEELTTGFKAAEALNVSKTVTHRRCQRCVLQFESFELHH